MIDEPQLSVPVHVTLQLEVVQEIAPEQLPSPSHSTVHEVASPHEIVPVQLPAAEHLTSQSMPAGQLTEPGGSVNSQVSAVRHTPPAASQVDVSHAITGGASDSTQNPPLHVRPASQSVGDEQVKSLDRRSTRQLEAASTPPATARHTIPIHNARVTSPILPVTGGGFRN